MEPPPNSRRADFSERALAFAADAGLFVGAWAATLKFIAPHEPLAANPKSGAATFLWAGVFLVYQAYFSSEGRASLGKSLFGLSVVGADDEPLGLGQGIVRSLGYLISQICAAGFLWALVDSNGRCWHDLPVGSRVIARRPLEGGRRVAFRALAGVLMIALAGGWGWRNVWQPRQERLLPVAYARDGLKEFVQLQKTYKAANGRYADNILSLATASLAPHSFLRDSFALYAEGRVDMKADRNHFTITARANDVDNTLVAVSGP